MPLHGDVTGAIYTNIAYFGIRGLTVASRDPRATFWAEKKQSLIIPDLKLQVESILGVERDYKMVRFDVVASFPVPLYRYKSGVYL